MNTKQAFAHLKKMSGRLDKLSVPTTNDPLKFASDIHLFYYNRFGSQDFSVECELLLAAGPLALPFYLVSMPGEVKNPTQGVNV